jgi:hypothetical protein
MAFLVGSNFHFPFSIPSYRWLELLLTRVIFDGGIIAEALLGLTMAMLPLYQPAMEACFALDFGRWNFFRGSYFRLRKTVIFNPSPCKARGFQ